MSKAIPSKVLATERSENEETMFSKFRHWIYFVAYVMLGLLVAIIVLLVTLVVMKQVDAVAESDQASPLADAVVLVVPNTTAELIITPNSTAEPVITFSTTAEPVTPSTTALLVPVISDVKRVGRPKIVTITTKVTERPLLVPKRTPYCTWMSFRRSDECSTDYNCQSRHGFNYPYCVHSEGPSSRKICCVFV